MGGGGKYHCTVGLLFDCFGISCITDKICFYLQNRLIQTKQEVSGTVILPPLVREREITIYVFFLFISQKQQKYTNLFLIYVCHLLNDKI
jgi:hypothetical protein